jgi:hypothetical protein
MLSHDFLTLQFVGYVSKLLPEAREANPGIGQENEIMMMFWQIYRPI